MPILPAVRDPRLITVRRGGTLTAHDLAAAYAIHAASTPDLAEASRLHERDWQREQLPQPVRALMLDDQRRRNDICWFAFSDQ